MSKKNYSDYIEISPEFESVVDIDADKRNENLWREYIVGNDMENVMEYLCQSLGNEAPDARRSFWIEGTYGTGKSYAAIFVKHLIEDTKSDIDKFLSQNSRLSTFRNRFMKCRKNNDYLVIWKAGCTGIRDGNVMLMELEKCVRNALAEKFGDKADYGEESISDAVKAHVHNPAHNWEYILKTTELSDSYNSVEKLQEMVDSDDIDALRRTAAVIRRYNWGLVDSLETFKMWISKVIDNNGLNKSGIFFIWDEFTEYVANSDDITILQQLSEFCKVKPFFTLFVVHRTSEMVERITPERYQLINHRFHRVEFHISADASFDLIAGSIRIRNGMEEHWKEDRAPVIKGIKQLVATLDGLDDKIDKNIEHFCPMHPMTIKLLSRVAENYAASQRTMFRFMKDSQTPDQGFAGYIGKFGPEDQACWLTPDWLWDYFFTRESDFSDKDTKAAEYIRHYEESFELVENDENALRIFKTAMLLMAIMSSTKGMIFSGRKNRDGIAATEECLNNCLAGVIDATVIHDLLETMQESKILVLDKDSHDVVRLQLPFKGIGGDDFTAKYNANDKKFSRYMMFSKDGAFSQEIEKNASDDNDPLNRRMKIVACCAETASINTRCSEISKELEKCPYKLGVLLVAVQSEAQAISIQATLQTKAKDSNEPRLIIALLKKPFTDEDRKKWLTAITKQEMASDSGQTGSANQYRTEAQTILVRWVNEIISGGKIVAYNMGNVYPGIYGAANLRNIIRKSVFDMIFKYAPENIVVTNTAYKTCNDSAPMAGIQRKSNNSQLTSVLNALKSDKILDLTTIDDMCVTKGGNTAECVAALASLIKSEMDSGQKVSLSELWETLKREPYGYYDTIACGVLLGYVFSYYANSKYSWIDSAQAANSLTEEALSKMIYQMCKGKVTTDYLSAGTVTWQNFSEYLGKIFNLPAGKLVEQNSGYQNVREAIMLCGVPFWALKYLPDSEWTSVELKETANQIIDNIQAFVAQEGDVESAMSSTLSLFKGKGIIKKKLIEKFQNKNEMAEVFRSFLFGASPELKKIATKLSVQPEELNDKLHSVMQAAIYTWTEADVKDKLNDVVGEYQYLDEISNVQGKVYHSSEEAKKDLENLFKHMRISLSAIESLNKPWFGALKILYSISTGEGMRVTATDREKNIDILRAHGKYAKDCLVDGKSVLSDILLSKKIECTEDELLAIYSELKEMTCNTSLSQFERELNSQIGRIKSARNKMILRETWRQLTGFESIKEWCVEYEVPLAWVLPRDMMKSFNTLSNVFNSAYTQDADVVSAIDELGHIDADLISNRDSINAAFLSVVGIEYKEIWSTEHKKLINDAKHKLGNDMSKWTIHDLSDFQKMLKHTQQEKAKKEKLAGTKEWVRVMSDTALRKRVMAFLDQHPEFCDNFSD